MSVSEESNSVEVVIDIANSFRDIYHKMLLRKNKDACLSKFEVYVAFENRALSEVTPIGVISIIKDIHEHINNCQNCKTIMNDIITKFNTGQNKFKIQLY